MTYGLFLGISIKQRTFVSLFCMQFKDSLIDFVSIGLTNPIIRTFYSLPSSFLALPSNLRSGLATTSYCLKYFVSFLLQLFYLAVSLSFCTGSTYVHNDLNMET